MWNKQIQLGNLISNFRKIFDSSYDEQERGACDSLVNLCRTKKKQRRRSFIPKCMCELDFSLFSFSTGMLINIQLRCVLNITYIFSKEVKWCVKEFVFWFVALNFSLTENTCQVLYHLISKERFTSSPRNMCLWQLLPLSISIMRTGCNT